jgi:hypothetical protein
MDPRKAIPRKSRKIRCLETCPANNIATAVDSGRKMRIAPLVLASLGVLTAAGAQSPARQIDFELLKANVEFRRDILRRAEALRPARRDGPLRYLNISDNEVREIQLEAKKFVPRSLVNISPVVTGCPCEEGPQCTDQVHIVAVAGDKSFGMQLSRVRNAWQVSAVQKWWWSYQRLEARRPKMDWLEFDSAVTALAGEFPVCSESLVPAMSTTSTRKDERKQ